VKAISIRAFRALLARLIDGRDPVLVTRHARPVAVLYPLGEGSSAPAEVRRQVLVDRTASLSRDLDTDPDPRLRAAFPDPVVEVYKRDVDRTLLRENLRLSPEDRLRKLAALQAFVNEVRRRA
jgi:hypothetical protein